MECSNDNGEWQNIPEYNDRDTVDLLHLSQISLLGARPDWSTIDVRVLVNERHHEIQRQGDDQEGHYPHAKNHPSC